MKTVSIENLQMLEEIIKSCSVCFIGMVDEEGYPYVLPFNFAYENQTIYLHSGNEGKKLKILRKKSEVCISFCKEGELYIQSQQIGCSYSMQFQSVIAFGKAVFVHDFDEKTEIMHKIMHHYTENRAYIFGKPAIENILCYKVKIEKMTGRQRGIV